MVPSFVSFLFEEMMHIFLLLSVVCGLRRSSVLFTVFFRNCYFRLLPNLFFHSILNLHRKLLEMSFFHFSSSLNLESNLIDIFNTENAICSGFPSFLILTKICPTYTTKKCDCIHTGIPIKRALFELFFFDQQHPLQSIIFGSPLTVLSRIEMGFRETLCHL